MTYITPSKVFSHMGRLVSWDRGAVAAPVTVEVDLSNACSLGCQSCHFAFTHVAGPHVGAPAPDGFEKTGRFADSDVFARAFADMRQIGVRGLVFTGGGEPTLHPKFETFVEQASGLELGMYTLGGHLPEARAALVRDRFTWVVVSLDAADAATYAAEKRVPAARFDEACAGIRRLAGGKATIGVSFLLHAGNWNQISAMHHLALKLGAHYVTFRPTVETDAANLSQIAGDRSWVTEALPLLRMYAACDDVELDPERFIEYRDWQGHGYSTCYGIRLVTQITPDGRVWVCPNRRGIVGSELGDLTRESFSAIWARHPGRWSDLTGCRAMCRLNPTDGELCLSLNADVYPFGALPAEADIPKGVMAGWWRHECHTPKDLAAAVSGKRKRHDFKQMKNSGGRPVGYAQLFRYYPGFRFESYGSAAKYDVHVFAKFERLEMRNDLWLLHLGGPEGGHANWVGRCVPRWGAAS